MKQIDIDDLINATQPPVTFHDALLTALELDYGSRTAVFRVKLDIDFDENTHVAVMSETATTKFTWDTRKNLRGLHTPSRKD